MLIACALNYGIYFVGQATIGKKLLSDCFHVSGGAAAVVMFAMMLTCMASTFLSGVMVRLMENRCKGMLVGATALTCGTSLAMVFAVGQSATGGVLDGYQPEAVRVVAAWIYPSQAYQAVLLGCAGVGLVAVLAALRIRESADGGVTAG